MKLRFFHLLNNEVPIYECDFAGWVPQKDERVTLTLKQGDPVYKDIGSLMYVDGVVWLLRQNEVRVNVSGGDYEG